MLNQKVGKQGFSPYHRQRVCFTCRTCRLWSEVVRRFWGLFKCQPFLFMSHWFDMRCDVASTTVTNHEIHVTNRTPCVGSTNFWSHDAWKVLSVRSQENLFSFFDTTAWSWRVTLFFFSLSSTAIDRIHCKNTVDNVWKTHLSTCGTALHRQKAGAQFYKIYCHFRWLDEMKTHLEPRKAIGPFLQTLRLF